MISLKFRLCHISLAVYFSMTGHGHQQFYDVGICMTRNLPNQRQLLWQLFRFLYSAESRLDPSTDFNCSLMAEHECTGSSQDGVNFFHNSMCGVSHILFVLVIKRVLTDTSALVIAKQCVQSAKAFSVSPSLPTSMLGADKRLGGYTVGTVEPNWPKADTI